MQVSSTEQEGRRPRWHYNYETYRQMNPQITTDRQPPTWFLDELRKLDPQLRVEWWNIPYRRGDGPSFRLIRLAGDGRWAHIDWFRSCSYALLKSLRLADTWSSGKGRNEIIQEEAMAAYRESKLVEQDKHDTWERLRDEGMMKATDSEYQKKGHRLYSYG